MLDEATWKLLTANRSVQNAAPSWAIALLRRPFSEILTLSETTKPEDKSTTCRPRLDWVEITPAYISFLKREIESEARGRGWSDLLRTRLDALIPYENKKLGQVLFSGLHEGRIHHWLIMFRPDDFVLVHCE